MTCQFLILIFMVIKAPLSCWYNIIISRQSLWGSKKVKLNNHESILWTVEMFIFIIKQIRFNESAQKIIKSEVNMSLSIHTLCYFLLLLSLLLGVWTLLAWQRVLGDTMTNYFTHAIQDSNLHTQAYRYEISYQLNENMHANTYTSLFQWLGTLTL